MRLYEIYAEENKKSNLILEKDPVISFEIFPPKNDEDGSKLEKLIEHLLILKKYTPAFISLTYGAGGTNQSFSLSIIKRIQNELNLMVMPHFTCICSSKEQVRTYLNEINQLNIKNILALRGDIPVGYEKKSFAFNYANELVEFIKSETPLSIAVAGYPEGHIDCTDLNTDLDNLKRKVDAGADVIYTQMFFDNNKFFDFMQSVRDKDIKTPVIPGILPINSYKQLDKMLSMAKVTLPKPLIDRLEKHKNNPEDIKKIGIEFASEQCQQLIEAKTPGLHFFTLNISHSVSKILDNLSLHHRQKIKI